MRPLLLLIIVPLLVAATWLGWQHRFEVVPASPFLDLPALVAAAPLAAGISWERPPGDRPRLALAAGTPAAPTVQRFPLPGLPPAEFLLMDFKARAEGLVPGPQPWADGRLMIEWHPGGRVMVPEYLGSARENLTSEVTCLVASSDLGPCVPVLRLEHLGTSGRLLLERCRVTVVRETGWWRHGRWLLLAGWFAWAAAVALSGRTSGPGRPLLAAAVWLLCATQWAVPGPWQVFRPMAAEFAGIPAPPESPAPAPAVRTAPPETAALPQAPPVPSPAAAGSLGELELGGSVLLKIKDKLKQARPLFHVLLFFAPALVLAFLAGRGRSAVLCAALAAAIEGSQVLFGYGFDRTDVLDLLLDAAGVGLALLAHHRLIAWLRKRRPGGDRELPAETSSGQPA